MTRLLVSVRNVAEARTALEVGVDLLDLKEPNDGALGAVAPSIVTEVVTLVGDRIPVSVALGELLDLTRDGATPLAVSRGITFYKLGLAGCASQPNWVARWQSFIQSQPQTSNPVAVIYADGEATNAPSADEVLAAAEFVGSRTVLVDTAIKDGRGLLEHWSLETLQHFLSDARRRGFTTVVGGGLTLDTIPRVAACRPDYIAVRGAACSGPRTGTLCAARLSAVKERLSPLTFAT